MIDLGLPSGTLWACCNVGANKPEGLGGHYAWGEIEEKHVYTWATYTHCDGSARNIHNIGRDISGTKYDVAAVKWGNGWRMPTMIQFDELVGYTTNEWVTVNGVRGKKFKSKFLIVVFIIRLLKKQSFIYAQAGQNNQERDLKVNYPRHHFRT